MFFLIRHLNNCKNHQLDTDMAYPKKSRLLARACSACRFIPAFVTHPVGLIIQITSPMRHRHKEQYARESFARERLIFRLFAVVIRAGEDGRVCRKRFNQWHYMEFSLARLLARLQRVPVPPGVCNAHPVELVFS